MGDTVTCLVWPQTRDDHGSAELALAVAACLPREHTRFRQLTASRSYQEQIWSMGTHIWALSEQGEGEVVSLLLHDQGAVHPLQAGMLSANLYWRLVARRSWEPQWDLDSHQLDIVVSWPNQYPRCDVWEEAVDRPIVVEVNLNDALNYRACRAGSTGLEYIVSFFRRLQETPHAGHAIGYLNDPSPVNAFMIWHRDICHFATDLAWVMAQSAGTCFYLDPRLGGTGAHAEALAVCAGGGDGGEEAGPALQVSPARMRDPKGYTPPLLTAEVLGKLARRADEVAVALGHIPPAELTRIGAACSTCIFEPLDGGAFLWTPQGVFACVDEFYWRLAKLVLGDVG